MIGGIVFDSVPGLDSDSDGDVVFHAICNAITSVTGIPVMCGIALDLCQKDGITDSQVYLEKAAETLRGQRIEHIALSLEAKRPQFLPRVLEMRKKIASILKLEIDQVGVTAIYGDGLTDFGLGEGVHCICMLTTNAL